MSFDFIRENKILAKISEFTVSHYQAAKRSRKHVWQQMLVWLQK